MQDPEAQQIEFRPSIYLSLQHLDAVDVAWVVERTLGWLMQHRRLARDYETRPTNSEAMITLAMIDNLTRRLTDETNLTRTPNQITPQDTRIRRPLTGRFISVDGGTADSKPEV